MKNHSASGGCPSTGIVGSVTNVVLCDAKISWCSPVSVAHGFLRLGRLTLADKKRLIYAEYQGKPFHILLAADVDGDNVRVVTAYYPAADEWEGDFKRRRVVA